MKSDDCCGLIGKILGHKYVPRYDTSKPNISEQNFKLTSVRLDFDKILEELKSKTYVCDVCERCGKKLFRSSIS